nr:DUF3631 domain-containing protein [Mycobacteroides abscessus]
MDSEDVKRGEQIAQSGKHAPADSPPVPVDGAALLAEVERFIRRFTVLPTEHAYVALVLWAVHTHFIAQLETTPRLACLSTEPGSGKTRVLEILDLLCHNPLLALDLSMSAFFRIVDDMQPSILLDEVDAIFTGKSKSEATEDLRRVINNGYRIGAVVQRVGGKNRDQVHEFRVFTPVAMAGLGNLPDTLMSRSVIIKMKRRAPGEKVEQFRDRLHRPVGRQIAERIAQWASEVGDLQYPELPEGVADRDADVWEPLLMVAAAAGGDWPQRAEKACLAFIADKPESSVSLGVRLLADIQKVWPEGAPTMFTGNLLMALADMEDAPWADLYGEGLRPRKLSKLLSDYGIKSKDVRVSGVGNAKGYRREDFWDAWQRYCPPVPDEGADEGSHSLRKGDIRDIRDTPLVTSGNTVSVTDTNSDKGDTPQPCDQAKQIDVADVTDVALSQGMCAMQSGRSCPGCGAKVPAGHVQCPDCYQARQGVA